VGLATSRSTIPVPGPAFTRARMEIQEEGGRNIGRRTKSVKREA
jgi:hypothetical protein